MVKNNKTRRGRGLGVVSRLWSPFNHLFLATGDSVQQVGSTTGRIIKETIGLPAKVGRTFARHSNMAIHNVFSTRSSKRSTKRSGTKRSGTKRSGSKRR